MGYGHCTPMYHTKASFSSFLSSIGQVSINYVREREARIVCPYHVQLVENYRSQIYTDPYGQPIKPDQVSQTYHTTLQYLHHSHQHRKRVVTSQAYKF